MHKRYGDSFEETHLEAILAEHRVGREQQSTCARHVRGSHRSAAQLLVEAAGLATEDAAARRAEVNGNQSIAGRGRAHVVVISVHHSDDID